MYQNMIPKVQEILAQSDILHNANADGSVTFKSCNLNHFIDNCISCYIPSEVR